MVNPPTASAFHPWRSDQVKEHVAGKFRALSVQGGGPAINVVIALDSGRKCKFAQAERIPGQQL